MEDTDDQVDTDAPSASASSAPVQPRFEWLGRLALRLLGVDLSLQLWANMVWTWKALARQGGFDVGGSSK
eukprot:COSAG02_NODE_2801_length_8003_cov_5.731655_2_plen_70_part_00